MIRESHLQLALKPFAALGCFFEQTSTLDTVKHLNFFKIRNRLFFCLVATRTSYLVAPKKRRTLLLISGGGASNQDGKGRDGRGLFVLEFQTSLMKRN